MRLPNGDQAIIEDRKLVDYVLNPVHPVGKHHARLFRSLLGITRGNYGRLKDALVAAARESEIEPGQPSAHGQKFEMRFRVPGPRGEKSVLAVWLIEAGSDRPRLITCYVE